MPRTAEQLRDDAKSIWLAGLRGVDSGQLVREHMQLDGKHLCIGDETIDLDSIERIAIVGAGKAGAGMAAAVEQIFGKVLLDQKQAHRARCPTGIVVKDRHVMAICSRFSWQSPFFL